MENLWFNEDDDCVSGYKACFESKEHFIKEANRLHVEQTGYGCIVDEVECNVFILPERTLQGESAYLLEDSGVEIATLYYANCESLESYDLKDSDGNVKLNDGTVLNLKGQIIEMPKCESQRGIKIKYIIEITEKEMVKKFIDDNGNEFKETWQVKGPGITGTDGKAIDDLMEEAGIDDQELLEAIYDGDLDDIWSAIRSY